MVKIKLNEKEFVDTDKMNQVAVSDYGVYIYQALTSKRFFKVYPGGTQSNEEEVKEVSESDVYEFIMEHYLNADQINKKIEKYLPEWQTLIEVE